MRRETLPSNYVPPAQIRLFSNVAQNVRILFLVDRHVPLLIGEKGGKPKIWINAPVKANDGVRWLPMIRNSLSVHPAFRIEDSSKGVTQVFANDKKCLEVRAKSDEFIVTYLDLRPIGLVIYGADDALYVGKARLAENWFSGLDIMISNHQHTEPTAEELAAEVKKVPRGDVA